MFILLKPSYPPSFFFRSLDFIDEIVESYETAETQNDFLFVKLHGFGFQLLRQKAAHVLE
jgi:hypothetical protein